MGRQVPRSIHNILFNLGVPLSYLFFPRSYRWYWLNKRIGIWLIGLENLVMPRFDPGRHRVLVEGFRHSANGFVVGLVESCTPEQIHSHSHHIWSIPSALRAGVVPIVLIRRPREVMLSTLRRTEADWYYNPHRLYAATSLLIWHSFYRNVRKYADRVCLVSFDEITSPATFPKARERIAARTGVRLAEFPDFSPVNPSPEPKNGIRVPPWVERLLPACDRLYDELAGGQPAQPRGQAETMSPAIRVPLETTNS